MPIAICPQCGKERILKESSYKHADIREGKCRSCGNVGRIQPHGLHSKNWKGGRIRNAEGYIEVYLDASNFFSSMVFRCKPYVLEHRLIMAQYLGRCLQPWEIVHHKNGIKDDNRIENLELTGTNGEHIREHNSGYKAGFRKGYYEGINLKIRELERRIKQIEGK